MRHVTVQWHARRTDQQWRDLTAAITKAEESHGGVGGRLASD